MLPVALSEDPRTYVCERDRYYYKSETCIYVCAVGQTLRNHSAESVSLSIYDYLRARRKRGMLIFACEPCANCDFTH